jgi:SAM-dependent methyltransferase
MKITTNGRSADGRVAGELTQPSKAWTAPVPRAEYETEQSPLLDRLLTEGAREVTDLGAGLGRHAGYLLERGCTVVAVDRVLTAEVRTVLARDAGRGTFVCADLAHLPFASGSHAALWASHCLEHMLNPPGALAEWRRVLRPGGLLGIAVPPFKTEVVGQHVFTGWTVGQLMLTLLRAGFDVRHGAYLRHLYNVCAIVRRDEHPPALEPDDEILYRYHDRFPPAIEADILHRCRANQFGQTVGSFEGEIERLQW